jgi:hypothetical protein
MSTTHTAVFENAILKSTELKADTKIAVGLDTEQTTKELTVVGDAPEIRIQDKTGSNPEVNQTTLSIVADGGVTHFRAGTSTFDTTETKGDIKFQSSTGDSTHAIITGTGRVGVGTTNPGQKLSIYTGSTATSALSFDRFSSGNYRTDIYQNTYGPDFRVGYGAYTPESILYLKRYSDGTKEVEINGSVGIGTASTETNTRLQVYHNEEQITSTNHFINYISATITGSTALNSANRYVSGYKIGVDTQFSGSSPTYRHFVRGVDSFIRSTGTANPHYMYGVEGASRTASTGTISYILAGGRFYAYQEATSSQPISSLMGTYNQSLKYGTGDVTYCYASQNEVNATTGSITNLYGVNCAMTNAGASITTSYQFKAVTNQSSGSITTNYGLHLSSQNNLDHYMEAQDVQWRTPYYTNQRHLHLNETTGDFNQVLNYTQYATRSGGANQNPDSSMGLWIGNYTDENWTSYGRNFIAWTERLQLYNTTDRTDFLDSLTFTSNTDTLLHAGTAFDKVGYFDGATANSDLNNFTGQHRCLVEEVRHDQAEEHEGLIVCANKNEYFKMSGGTDFTFTVNEALPLVSLSKKAMDKSCFGVISSSEDPENRVDRYGTFTAQFEKEKGDTRIYINSVGEGGIWVINANGNLESGDYITTSNVVGYGMKQDSEFLANYSVAKITCDCDFNPIDKPVKRIVRAREDYDVWYAFKNITFAEYSNTASNKTRTFEETYYTIQQLEEVSKSNETIDVTLYVEKAGDAKISVEAWNDLSSEEQAEYDKKDFKYIDVDVSVDEYPDATMHTTRYQKINDKTEELPKNEKEASKFTYKEIQQRWVNVLDEHGQLQWEDDPSGATEKAYKIRYLTADGTETDEANAVHIAAFVGCTYHCG